MTDYERRLWDQYSIAALTGLLAESANPSSTGWSRQDEGVLAERCFDIAYKMLDERTRRMNGRKA